MDESQADAPRDADCECLRWATHLKVGFPNGHHPKCDQQPDRQLTERWNRGEYATPHPGQRGRPVMSPIQLAMADSWLRQLIRESGKPVTIYQLGTGTEFIVRSENGTAFTVKLESYDSEDDATRPL